MYTCIQDFTHIERFVIINYDLPMEVKLSCEAFMYERGDKIKVKYNEVIQDIASFQVQRLSLSLHITGTKCP